AWLRTLARFSRTYLGSFWMGLSNLLSVALLGAVYGAVLKVPNPYDYVIYLGFGLTVWGMISMSVVSGCALFTTRRDQLVNNALPAIFYCLEEWAFQLQTFAQSFAIILAAFAFIHPSILLHTLTSLWLPLLNLGLFCFWVTVVMAVLGSRFKDVTQLMPILLQLMFLLSPILYKREGLGKAGMLADFNPFYRILAPVRSAVIDGHVHLGVELVTLALNVALVVLVALWLKRLRYRLPLWV
ncbi:MAG: ABC transporter permease, partial [Prochlorococcaceae cyanobacterium MAG_34]|nr:ABC transporter permease [Prochlorococcaceae cyanobacterium MAG_34]